MKKQILKNLLANYVGNGLAIALGLLVVPVLIKTIGTEAFGIICLAEALIAIFQLLLFSLRIAIARFVTFAFAKNDEQELLSYIAVGRFILQNLSLIFGAAGILIIVFCPMFLSIPQELVGGFRILLGLIVLSLMITLPNIIHWAILYSRQRMDLINSSYYGGLILRGVFIITLFMLLPTSFKRLELYGAIYLAMTLFQNYFVYFWQRKVINQRIEKVSLNKERVREVLSYSGFSALGNVGGAVVDGGINIAVNILWGPAANAIYSVATRIPNLLMRFFKEPTSSLTPTFTALFANNDMERAKQLVAFYTKIINVLVLPMGIFFVLYGIQIIEVWVGPSFEPSAAIMPYLVGATLISIFASICGSFLAALGNVKLPAIVNNLYTVGIFLLGTIFCIGFGMYLEGIALAVLVSQIIGPGLFLTRQVAAHISFPFLLYWTELFLVPLTIAVVPAGIFFLLIQKGNGAFGQFLWVAAGILGIVTSYILSYFINFNEKERKEILGLWGLLQAKVKTKAGYA